LSYTVVLDGRRLPTPAGAFEMRLNSRGLGSGRHSIQVLATDRDGQATLTSPSTLMVDGQPPAVKVTLAGGGDSVNVRISDPYSGVDAGAVRVSFGDGGHAGGRTLLRHRYTHPGVYRIAVDVRDKLGNQAVVRRLVSVR
jgi:PKD domain